LNTVTDNGIDTKRLIDHLTRPNITTGLNPDAIRHAVTTLQTHSGTLPTSH
jgi:hypothetical protein